MTKQGRTILIIAVVIIIAFLLVDNLGLFASVGGSVTRSVPTTATPGSTITVTYTASGTGTFGVSIEDNVAGCTFSNGKTSYKDVILSDGSLIRTMTVTAPNSGTCTFSGNYMFGSDSIVNMPNSVVTISTPSVVCSQGQTKCEGTTYYTCSNNLWASQGLVVGQCGYTSGTTNPPVTPPTFDLSMVLFNLGTFAVTLKLLLMILGGLFIVKLVMG